MKKYIVLGILFILPITVYIFFASAKNNFAKLPTLTSSVKELSGFQNLDGGPIALEGRITVLGFFGTNLEAHKAYAYNLAHEIYRKNHAFEDFQFVILLPLGTEAQAEALHKKLAQIADPHSWEFAFGTPAQIRDVFGSLQSDFVLDEQLSSPYVFLIDKERALRGRDEDEDEGMMYGFDSRKISEINNKMDDDVKVLLAEYRLALKKYDSKREI